VRATVDDNCTGCGLCQEICPEVFRLGSADKAAITVDRVPQEDRERCLEAEAECPVEAIHAEE